MTTISVGTARSDSDNFNKFALRQTGRRLYILPGTMWLTRNLYQLISHSADFFARRRCGLITQAACQALVFLLCV